MGPRKQPSGSRQMPQRHAIAVALNDDRLDNSVAGAVGYDSLSQGTSAPRLALSIDEFCRLHAIGRRTLYDLWAAGGGPRFFKVGARVLISVEAAAAWRRQLEDETADQTRPQRRAQDGDR